MAREMTPQERAAAIVDKVKSELTPIWLGGRQRMLLEQEIAEAIIATRRAALLEAAEEIERFIDYSGGCVGTENDPRVVAVNRFITINIVPLLNRLAQEGS